jgi:hypothetical protein
MGDFGAIVRASASLGVRRAETLFQIPSRQFLNSMREWEWSNYIGC